MDLRKKDNLIKMYHSYKQKEMDVDETQSDELEISFNNERSLYSNKLAWIKNFARKMKNGSYNHEKAVFGIQKNLVPNIIKSYDGIELSDVDRQTRNHLAKSIVKSFEDTIKIDYKGNYDEVIRDL